MTDETRNNILAFRAGYLAGLKDKENKSPRDAENHLRLLDLPITDECIDRWGEGHADAIAGDNFRYELTFSIHDEKAIVNHG